jgi:hypothetical protein
MNDPAMQPINGISLERYADLGAAIDDVKDDRPEVEKVLTAEGVTMADWDAAIAGWTARMQDMSLMGRVAMAYGPMYQTALAARKGGAASCSYADFLQVSAAIKAFGWEAAMNACGVSMSEWTEVSGEWNTTMQQDPGRYAGHFPSLEAEAARLSGGGQPNKVTITRTAGALPAAAVQPNLAAQPGANAMDVAMQQAMNNPMVQQQNAANAAVAANPLGFLGGQVGAVLTGGIRGGSKVLVAWSDGNHYPGTVMQATPGQFQVRFDNGSIEWCPEAYVKQA